MTIAQKFTREIDAVFLMFSLLKRLNCGAIATFEDRIKSQKIQYLAQVCGVSPSYKYNLYIRGPYSPDLANDLYTIHSHDLKAEARIEKFVPEELESRFEKLASFVKGKTVRQLELVTTYHWFRKTAELNDKEAVDNLKRFKKAQPDEIENTLALFNDLCKISLK